MGGATHVQDGSLISSCSRKGKKRTDRRRKGEKHLGSIKKERLHVQRSVDVQ